jgi:ABC-type proline/glycine betaine transport system substrate-binding protein
VTVVPASFPVKELIEEPEAALLSLTQIFKEKERRLLDACQAMKKVEDIMIVGWTPHMLVLPSVHILTQIQPLFDLGGE